MLTYEQKLKLIKQIKRELREAESFKDLERIEKLIWLLKISPRNEKTKEQWFRTYNEILELENRLIKAFVNLTVSDSLTRIKELDKETKSKRAKPLPIKA
jgi:GTPase involved in cell partitioning and DNA repair